MRPLRLVNLALFALLLGGSAVAYPHLPPHYPVHFDLQGHPNRWVSGTSVEWFLLSILAVFVVGLLMGVGQLALRRPDLVNFQGRDRLLRLPPARQREVLRYLVDWLDALGTAVLVMFCLIQAGLHEGAHGRPFFTLTLLGTGVVAVFIPVAVIVMTVTLNRRIEAQEREMAAAGAGVARR